VARRRRRHRRCACAQNFEDSIRSHRFNPEIYISYAKFEDSQREFDRARSVFERGLDIDYKYDKLWTAYITMELRHKFINRARNVLDRVTALLPRMDKFWYKYAFVEEAVGNLNNARSVFERWMRWEPDERAWQTYINFEIRAGETDRARVLFERFVSQRPSQAAYVKYARWEERNDQLALARRVFERAIDELDSEEKDDALFGAFAEFEARCGEYDRARAIFQFALKNLAPALAREVQAKFVLFEKQHGEKEGIETVLVAKKREEYAKIVEENPHNYDAWFDWTRMEEAEGDIDKIREVYERAIGSVPPVEEKKYWRRYIYLWLNYAIFEELGAEDVGRAREVYSTCLRLVPHAKFTFAKVWVMAAHMEVRQKELGKARKLLGRAIGTCPKPKLFKEYIQLEARLQEVDRVRILYAKYLEFAPFNVEVWRAYAKLEQELGEVERARKILSIGIEQPVLDKPEVLWQALIDFEIENGDADSVRSLYRQLLDRTQHVRAFLDFAKFEAGRGGSVEKARELLERANRLFRETGQKEERALVLREWLDVERSHAADQGVAVTSELDRLEKMQPTAVREKRPKLDAEGQVAGYEEVVDFVFPEEKKATGLKLLERARMWKAAQEAPAARKRPREDEDQPDE
jgi:crooked neck